VLKIGMVLVTTFLFAAMLIAYPHAPASANHARVSSVPPVPHYMHPRQKAATATALPSAKEQGRVRTVQVRHRHDLRKIRAS
jgi:hypothetical protein